mgnify:CR=1 FL=1
MIKLNISLAKVLKLWKSLYIDWSRVVYLTYRPHVKWYFIIIIFITFTKLYKKIYSVIVEGGAQTLNTFLKENLWDEIKVFKSKKKLVNGINAPVIQSTMFSEEKIMDDKLITYFNK